jgi:small redox-active disulfide protein 2
MKVEILGPGCKRCDQLYENTVSAVSDLGSPADIEVTKVKDVDYFTKMGVFMTPGLVIDGKVASVGKVLSVEQVKEKIKGNMAQGN